MVRTYKALLHGDHLEWVSEAPKTENNKPLRVQITVEEHEVTEEEHMRGHAMATVLEKLAARNALSGIADPVQWQREVRRDRVLPGHEG